MFLNIFQALKIISRELPLSNTTDVLQLSWAHAALQLFPSLFSQGISLNTSALFQVLSDIVRHAAAQKQLRFASVTRFLTAINYPGS